jgi:3-hydroxybutyryl-CoA dehydrogenase
MAIVAVIGAGMMGPGIAQVFASGGYTVRLHNRSAEKLAGVHDRVRGNLTRMAEYELVNPADIPLILDRIVTTTDMGFACEDATVVIETITESLPLK